MQRNEELLLFIFHDLYVVDILNFFNALGCLDNQGANVLFFCGCQGACGAFIISKRIKMNADIKLSVKLAAQFIFKGSNRLVGLFYRQPLINFDIKGNLFFFVPRGLWKCCGREGHGSGR